MLFGIVMLLKTSVQKTLDLVISEPIYPTSLDLNKSRIIFAHVLVELFKVEVWLFYIWELLNILFVLSKFLFSVLYNF